MNHTFLSLVRAGLIITPLLTASPLQAKSVVQPFAITAQPLADALLQFSEISGIKVFFSSDIATNLRSTAIKGNYSPEQVLKKLLAGSGLRYRYTDSHTITLEKSQDTANAKMLSATDNVKSSPAESTALETIIVKEKKERNAYKVTKSSAATKTDTPLAEIPMSIQVIPRALLNDQQTITVEESLQNVSGVVARSPMITPNFEPTLIRGFSAMQMLDGFYQNLNMGDQGSLVNIQEINVLKGANATLYSGGGGSPVGGVINLVSKKPEKKAFYEMGIKGGSYDFVQPYIDINQPLNNNALFRLTGEYTNNKSNINVLQTERFNINPTLTLTNNESTTLTLQGKFSKWKQQDYQGLPATGTITGNVKINPELFAGPTDIKPSISEFSGVWGTLDHKINEMWSVTLKGRYANSEHDTFSQGLYGSDGFSADLPFSKPSTWALSNVELYQKQNELSFQAYAQAKFDVAMTKNTLLFGTDFAELKEKAFMDFNMLPVGTVNLTAPIFSAYSFPGKRQNNQFTTNTTYGGYVQLQSNIAERLHLLAGVRLGYIDSHFKNTSASAFQANSSVNRFLPNVGAVFDITQNFSLFANYSEGMRAQSGVNFVSTPKPELSYQMEAGVKLNLAEQLSGQLSVFQIDREDVAVTDYTDKQLRSVAKGKQRSHGIESNVTWQPIEGLSLLGTYTFTEADYRDSLAGVPKGTNLPGIPAHSGRFWANYAFQQPMLDGLSVGAGVYAQSDSYESKANLYKVPAYYSVDANIGYKIKNYNLGVSVKNLTNNDYFQRLNYFGSRVTPAQGVAVYFTGSVHF